MPPVTARELALAERLVRTFPSDHPAKDLLIRHSQCRKNCAGREIAWPKQQPIEQEWFSITEQRKFTFSGLIYGFICFNADYQGWTQTAPPERLRDEDHWAIKQLPRMIALVNECKAAATKNKNAEILKLCPFVEAYLEASCRCIMSIVEQRLILISERPLIPFVNQVLNLPK